MSRRTIPSPAKLLVSVIYLEEGRFREVLHRIEALLGEVERTSVPFPFDRTDYYEREMGAPLHRRFAVMGKPVRRDALALAKVRMEELEKEFSVDGRRTVNLDPGLLTEENFILATGKNYSHRVYLGDGVFADLTLTYSRGEYRPLPWTYPDFASDGIRAFLVEVRAAFREAGKQKTREERCG
ncbi:MAG: DUF4416 family protein [Deltaproteobacteria bacterium]|nr:DUF4416 family protein [Deltaproteobacteria bacterium]